MKRLLQNSTSRSLLLAIGAGIALTVLLQSFGLNLFEAYFYDFRMRNQGKTDPSGHIVLVKIDDKTVENLNEFAPLSIKRHMALLKTLGASHPKAIAYFVNFNDVLTSQSDGEADRFVDTAVAFKNAGINITLGTDVDVTGEVVPPFPLSKLPHRMGIIHKDGATFSEDKVTRRALFTIYDEPTLHVQLASLINHRTSAADYRGINTMSDVDARYFFINYIGPTQEKYHTFTEVSAVDVLAGKTSPDLFKDKIVLIGGQTKDDASDYAFTPYARKAFTNPKLTIHANIIETLINDDAIVRASRPVELFMTFALTVLIIGMVFRTSPVHGVLITTACAVLLIAAGVATFHFFNLWIELAHPLLAIFLSYYVFVPYRLIVEYKQRWQFQKKNEVLVQVEELKSNFMNLITHDLKTPVARIQGMAEVLGRTGADAKIVSEILGSTDELNRFITSILELAKIESNRVELDRQSKDVNKIIEDCVSKFEFQARSKSIAVDLDLEPMFPIKLDAPLFTKVISNLIDNAIKYSPEKSRVTIESHESVEKPGFVEISVSDNGHGIKSMDLENLFTKFYRPENDITMQTKGTGLGLYLSRYFVELHQGSITAESVEGKGSIFTILLPVNQGEHAHV